MSEEIGDMLPAKKNHRDLRQLSPDAKAYIAHECFISYSKGETWKSMVEKHNITRHAAQVLVAEYAAMVREARPDTRTTNEEAYRFILKKAMDIIEDDKFEGGVLVKAKAFEAAIQSLTRLDKLGGHEAPNVNVNLEGQSLADVIQNIYGPDGPMDGVSPEDNAMLAEDIEDADIVEEGEDDTTYGEQEERPAD